MIKKRKIPFPQANSMNLIYSILLDISNNGISKREIAKKYEIDERQGSYYLDSLEFLGFVEKINTKYFYTEIGEKTISSKQCKKMFIKALLENIHISRLYTQTKETSTEHKKIIIANYICKNFGLSLSTSKRRASTIISWFNWIDEAINEEGFELNG